jgi:hypothetical protein
MTTSPSLTPSRADILRIAGEVDPANLQADGPFGQTLYPGKDVRALCLDGIVRTCRVTAHADTFFSVPARVKGVRGLTITGYLTTDTVDGYSTATPENPAILTFRANRYGKNGDMLPASPVWPRSI